MPLTEEEKKLRRAESIKKHNLKNKEKIAERKRKHYYANIEQYKARAKKCNQSDTRKKWRLDNKEKISAYHKERWNIIKDRKPHLKSNYGITLEDYNRMFDEQKGCCLGCERHQSDLKHPLCVDHDHVTGKVRGLLCKKCNSALGLVSDKVEVLQNLIKYLNA